ncbi:MAG: hypothetical protein ACYDBJ_01465 [Aggregatilineales bacterium]
MTTPTPSPRFDYHFLYLGPGMSGDWLFVAARNYWLTFRPNVILTLDLIAFVPPRRRIAITSLARRDTAQTVRADLAKRFPKAYHDPLVYDYLDEMQLTLDGRAMLNQRFGKPDSAFAS